MGTVQNNLLFKEGKGILVGIVLAAIIGYFIWLPLSFLAIAFCLFSLYFFRNPERKCPAAMGDPDLLVCPADGKVIAIEHDPKGFDGYPDRVSIFLSVADVHVNRMPMAGKIEKISYHPGSFVPAFVPKSSELNERNDITIVGPGERRLQVRQIAGIIARRIVCWPKEGETMERGARYGMIKFGSRVDILLPSAVTLYITKGQRVVGGSTILGRWQCNQQ